jgi:CHASE3 domain sensor protein
MKHSKKHNRQNSSGITKRSRKKTFWLLIILGVFVMLVYAVSFQNAKDSEVVQETQNQTEQQ